MSDFITNAELRIEAERLIDENDELRSEKAALERRIDELCAEVEAEKQRNAKLRELCSGLAQVVKNDDDTFRRLREIAKQELSYDFIGMYDSSLGKIDQIVRFIDSMRELGIEVPS